MNLSNIIKNSIIKNISIYNSSDKDIFNFKNTTLFSLNIIKSCIINIDYTRLSDLNIVPIIVSDYGYLEPYEFAFSLIITENPDNREKLLLKHSGKNSIEEISNYNLDLINNTLFELKYNSIKEFMECITKYIQYMEIKEKDLLNCELLKDKGIFYYEIR
ncbi:MAG: hypothetical protein VB118_11600 [Oscillospiraceae bacterium]|nr:hypothetical protein [Oscillospiraceae bacterium]